MRRFLNRTNLLLAVFIAVPLILRFTPWYGWLSGPDSLAAVLQRCGPWKFPAFLVLATGILLLGSPRVVIAFAAGSLFGFLPGLALSIPPVLVVAAAFYLLEARKPIVADAKSLPYQLPAVRSDLLKVLLLRQLPLPAPVVNLLVAKLRPRPWPFSIGTLLGILPQAALAAAGGAGLHPDGGFSKWLLLVPILIVGLVVLQWLAPRFTRPNPVPEPAADTHSED